MSLSFGEDAVNRIINEGESKGRTKKSGKYAAFNKLQSLVTNCSLGIGHNSHMYSPSPPSFDETPPNVWANIPESCIPLTRTLHCLYLAAPPAFYSAQQLLVIDKPRNHRRGLLYWVLGREVIRDILEQKLRQVPWKMFASPEPRFVPKLEGWPGWKFMARVESSSPWHPCVQRLYLFCYRGRILGSVEGWDVPCQSMPFKETVWGLWTRKWCREAVVNQ